MKKILYLFTFIAFNAGAQNILLVDDNNNITDNSDTLIATLALTNYTDLDYYNVADSAGVTPSSAFMDAYDVIIWYASTDGAGLGFWTAAENGDLIAYLAGGGRLWVIGSDLLYAEYPTAPATFSVGNFAYDFMGLASYDVQSYGNDGSIGVSEVDAAAAAPIYFSGQLTWIFATHWWVDGVTSRTGATDLYEMGPTGYALAGAVSMTHFKNAETNVMSTFFDPALINTRANRVQFLNQSLFYLLESMSVTETIAETISVSPNPAADQVTIAVGNSSTANFKVLSATGTTVAAGTLENGKAVAGLAALAPGMYLLTIDGSSETVKIIKQ